MSAPAVTTASIQATVTTIAADVSTGLATIQAALRAGTQTTADIRRALAVLTNAAEDIRAVRIDLDAYVATDQQLYPDGAITLALWQWACATRQTLTGLDGGIRKGIDIANELLLGRAQTRYAVRSGDTLQSIAARYLGSWQDWMRLVDANGLDPGATLAAGTVLTIPQRV